MESNIGKENIEFNPHRLFSVFEITMLVGSQAAFKDRQYSPDDIRSLVQENKLSPELFVPVGQKFPISQVEATQLENQRESQQDLIGIFPFLGEGQFELDTKGYDVRVQPVGMINPETGVTDPFWKVSIVDKYTKRTITRGDYNDLLKLDEAYGDIFKLEEDEANTKYLHLKEQ